MPELTRSTRRRITSRSVLYVGYPCNIRCRFCYYTYSPDKAWRSFDDTAGDARVFRKTYGHDRVDITGGEPTIYPSIERLVSHCAAIGLRPSLITNTQKLKEKTVVRTLADCGVHDFLCSIHALGERYDGITQSPSGWKNLERAIGNLNELGVPWRANCTMNRHVMDQLPEIARYVSEKGGRVLNFISFNPFYEWEKSGAADFQARHSEIRPFLDEALQYCDSVGLEANVRYMPLCQMKGHEEKCYNFGQMPYDSHEWNYATWVFAERGLFDRKTRLLWQYGVGGAVRLYGKLFGEKAVQSLWARKNKAMLYEKGAPCRECGVERICDCFTKQYAGKYGFDEAEPYTDVAVRDPLHFISRQEKVVD